MTKPSPSKVKATSGIAWKGVERFDEGALRKIIANLPQVLGKKEDDLAVRNMQWQLMRYLKGSVNGTREVEYVFAAGVPDGVGRIFPKYGVGMSIVKGVIRDSCCKDMIEMDIVNAHPTLLVQYAEKHGLPANLLQGYVERRDEYLGDLMRTFRCDRKAAKDTMLKYLNSKRAVNSGPAWLAPLALQLQDLQDAVTALNPTIREVKLHKWYNMQGSVMNLVLCTIERECIFSCKKFLKAAGVEVMMSQHDGCGCANDPQRPFTPEFLEELSLHVAQETGYTLKFAIKPMDKAIDVAALPKTELPLFLNPVHAVSKPTPLGLAGLSEAPEDPEFRVQAFPTTHPHVVVWARMGGGKTFRAREYAKSLGVESALFVTPRQVFSYSIQDGFLPVFPDLRHYKDTEGDPYQAPYLVVQLESLFKVKPEGYDLVILDECESVLSQMKSDTNTEFEQVYAMFEHILRSAKYSLWMDAFLSDRTLTTLKLLLPPKDICVVHNTYVDRVRRAVMLEVPPPPKRKKGEKPKKKKLSPRKKVLLKCFLDLARQNKRVVCMVGSVSFAQQLKEALKEAHPDQRVLVITRNASDKIKKANVEELWVKYDHIIYTSTVTVGTSFDPEIPHFHCALAYFSANSIRPRDMLQGLQRVRKLIDNVLYYVVSNSYCGHDRHPQFDLPEIREHLEKRTKHEEAHSKIAHHYPEWIKNLMARNQLEDNTSAYHHGELVHTLLEDAGYI
ncbi:hypothetical protein Ndes2437B_g08750 [Nannochloris sp. 'desiccata']